MLAEQVVKTLVTARHSAGLTQKQVAGLMGCHTSFVQQLETSNRDLRLSSVERYANALGVELEVTVKN